MISAKHNPVPCVPPSAPFTTEQRAWLNGFLAGLFATADNAAVLADSRKPVPKSLLILYGSQTGTAEARSPADNAGDWSGRVLGQYQILEELGRG